LDGIELTIKKISRRIMLSGKGEKYNLEEKNVSRFKQRVKPNKIQDK